MIYYSYVFKLIPDGYRKPIYINTTATNKKAAINKIMEAENCPESAITLVREQKCKTN